METAYSHRAKVTRILLPWLGLVALSFHSSIVAAAPAQDSGAARLSYSRTLKGSSPEYIAIIVNSDGTGTYDGRQLADPPHPQSFKLSGATLQKLFSLASDLHYFRSIDLESHKKVANLGAKVFTYEKDGQKSSVEYNFTVNKEADELSDLFEKIAMVEQHIQALEFAVKYDHLGLPHELLQIQIDLNNQALADPELMVPMLQEIARNPRFLHLAQVRAQDILARVQGSNQ
jgi:hypothetical protein